MVLQYPDTEILHKWSYRILIQRAKRSCCRDLVQVLLQDPDTSGPKDHHTEILKQRSCTSCPTGSWYRDLAQVVLEDPDTSGPEASWYEILCKWSYRILIQVVQKDPYTEMMQRSCTSANECRVLIQVVQKDPDTEILHKWSKRILKYRSCASAPQGWYKWSKRNPEQRDTSNQKELEAEILQKWCYKILIQAVQKDPHTEILKTDLAQVVEKDPDTEILQVVLKDPDTSGPKGSSYRGPTGSVLQEPDKDPDASGRTGAWYRDLAHVVLQDPDTSGPERSWTRSWYRDPHTEIFHKWFYRFLIQVVQKSGPTRSCKGSCIRYKWSKRILIQRSCTSDATGSWCKWSEGILIQIRILMQRSCRSGPTRSWVLIRAVQKILIQRSCTSGPTASWHKWSNRSLIQRSCTSGPTGWYEWSKRILIYRDLAQVVLQDRFLRSLKRMLTQVVEQESDTEILHNWSYRSWSKWFTRILIQRSCTSDPTGSFLQDPEKDPDASGQTGAWYRDLAQWSDRILIQILHKWCDRTWRKRSEGILIQIRILIQRSCKSGPTQSWILIRAVQKIMIQRPCASGPTASW